jgi:hypothetical protein
MTDFPDELVFDINEADRENILTGYEGEEPPNNARLTGNLKRMFLARDNEGTPMLKVLYQVEGGTYDGYPAWENVSLKPSAAFKWVPLCEDILKVKIEDLKKRTKIDRENETNAGWPVLSIGKRAIDGDLPVTFTVGYRNYTDPDTKKVSRQASIRDVEAL